MTTEAANKMQATPTNAAVRSLRSWAGLRHRFGVPDLIRWLPHCDTLHKIIL
jgi:hypothetical protein